MVLTGLADNVRVYEQWTKPEEFLRFLEGLNASRQFAGQDSPTQRTYRNQPVLRHGPSPDGTTWNGGLLIPFHLGPAARKVDATAHKPSPDAGASQVRPAPSG